MFTLFLLQTGATPASSWMGFLPILLIFGIFYFLLFLPMQRQRKNTAKMLAALKNGDAVVTSGGIIGTIVAIEGDDSVVLRVKPERHQDPGGAQRRYRPGRGEESREARK